MQVLSVVSLRLRLIDLSWRMYFVDQKARNACVTLLFISFSISWSNETSCPKYIYSVTYCISVFPNIIFSCCLFDIILVSLWLIESPADLLLLSSSSSIAYWFWGMVKIILYRQQTGGWLLFFHQLRCHICLPNPVCGIRLLGRRWRVSAKWTPMN